VWIGFRLALLAPALALSVFAQEAPAPTARPTPPPTPTPVPGDIHVVVTVTGADGRKGPSSSAVAWIPGSPMPAGPKAKKTMTSKDKRFDPRVVAVATGGTIDFPNVDKIYHNVFSPSDRNKFDLGLYRNGASRSMTFENPGLVKIYCNIHPQMAAYLMVVDGGAHAVTGPDGVAVLRGLRPGRYTVKVWDEKGGERSETADVASGRVTMLPVSLDATSWRDLPHKNKHGKDYPPPDDDENRY
jgi:plastocyanin